MSGDTKGFAIFIFGSLGLGVLTIASIIMIIYDGYEYFHNHDQSAFGWFIAGWIIIGCLILACIIGGCLLDRQIDRKEKGKLLP